MSDNLDLEDKLADRTSVEDESTEATVQDAVSDVREPTPRKSVLINSTISVHESVTSGQSDTVDTAPEPAPEGVIQSELPAEETKTEDVALLPLTEDVQDAEDVSIDGIPAVQEKLEVSLDNSPQDRDGDEAEIVPGEEAEDKRRESHDSKRRVRVSLEQQVTVYDEDLPSDYEAEILPYTSPEEVTDFELLLHDEDAGEEESENETEGDGRTAPRYSSGSIKSLMKKPSEADSAHISLDFLLEHRPTEIERLTLSSAVPLHMTSYKEVSIEETVDVEDEKDDITIDRHLYYQLYAVFKSQNDKEKLKNQYLQARLAMYYMRRKMYFVLRDSAVSVPEIKVKYDDQIEELGQLLETAERDRRTLIAEATHLQSQQELKHNQLNALFEKLQLAELDFGKTLTFDRTGRTNMDKVVERYVRRQKSQAHLLSKLRLTYIKLKNRTAETTAALDALDHLGPGFRIMDYVHLKTDNRNLYDKLEEKEMELSGLRRRCQGNMQELAHFREKLAALNSDIEKRTDDLDTVEMDHTEAREQLHFLQQERSEVRQDIKNLKAQYGLLTHPKMLLDMEKSIKEIDALRFNIELLQAAYYDKSKKILAVRRNREYAYAMQQRETRNVAHGPSIDSGSSWYLDKKQEKPEEPPQEPPKTQAKVEKRVRMSQ